MGAALVALALALTFGYLPYRLYSRSGFSRYLELSRELRHIERENARLRTDNARLGPRGGRPAHRPPPAGARGPHPPAVGEAGRSLFDLALEGSR